MDRTGWRRELGRAAGTSSSLGQGWKQETGREGATITVTLAKSYGDGGVGLDPASLPWHMGQEPAQLGLDLLFGWEDDRIVMYFPCLQC